jgi:hypothetical protein
MTYPKISAIKDSAHDRTKTQIHVFRVVYSQQQEEQKCQI